jgi:hypothetical protein
VNPLLDPFLAAADAVARVRPEVDVDLARELMGEAAVMLHNGLALDGLDASDTDLVVAGLCEALTDRDPSAAVRSRAETALADPAAGDAEAVRAAYLNAVAVLQL